LAKRKIINIDEARCNGCGDCIPNCPEGALQIIDGKARLISDLFCDGLGACIGHCPQDAIAVQEREAEPYDEKKVMKNIVRQGENVIKAHLLHLKDHGERGYLKEALQYLKDNNISLPELGDPAYMHHGCPGSKVMDLGRSKAKEESRTQKQGDVTSRLAQWPVQIMLIPPSAPFFKGADLLIAADCVPFAYGDFHSDLLKSRALLVGCPKLDDAESYKKKITEIFKSNDINSVACAHMEVPCCFGMVSVVKSAIEASGKDIPFTDITITIKGKKKA
jgi:ferredoxin